MTPAAPDTSGTGVDRDTGSHRGGSPGVGAQGGDLTLELKDLRVRYGTVTVASDITFSISPGEIVGLIGPNGAGKSSVLGAVAGEIAHAGGTVLLGGRDVSQLAAFRRARRGMVRTFQTARVYDGMTVYEGLLMAARGQAGASLSETVLHHRRQRRAEQAAIEHVWALLRRFGLEHIANHLGSELSGGQRRLVELLMALIRSPILLVLDEPMVGVARVLVPGLLEEIRRESEQGVAVLIVEHALEVVESLCDRVLVMADGAVLSEGTYDEVVADSEVRKAYLA